MNSRHMLKSAALGAVLILNNVAAAQGTYLVPVTPYMSMYTNGHGGFFNDPMSANLSSSILNMGQMNMAFSMANTAQAEAMVADQERAARGQQIIKAGKATTLFQPVPIQPKYTEWAKNDGSSSERKKWEFAEQMKIWNEAAKRYGANLSDYAHIQALAGLVAYEGYTGLRPSQNAWKARVADVKSFLLKDAYFQGLTSGEKATRANNWSMSGYAMFERQEYQRTRDEAWLKRAREHAAGTLDQLWNSDTKGVSDADDFARLIGKLGASPSPVIARWNKPTPYASGKPATPTATQATPTAPTATATPTSPTSTASQTPQLTVQQAIAKTNFKRVAPTVVPAQMAALAKTAQEKQQVLQLTEKLLEMARAQLAENASAGMPVDNVARSLGFAFNIYYTMGLTKPGQNPDDVDVPLTAAMVKKFRERAALSYGSSSAFTKLSDKEKQQYSELLLMMPMFTYVMYSLGLEDNDAQTQQDAINIARENFQELFGSTPERADLNALR